MQTEALRRYFVIVGQPVRTCWLFVNHFNPTLPCPIGIGLLALQITPNVLFFIFPHVSLLIVRRPISVFFRSLPSSLFSYFLFLLFANTTKRALVSPLNWCHCDFRFHDWSLSPSPYPLSLPFSNLFLPPFLPFLGTDVHQGVDCRHKYNWHSRRWL